MVDNKVSQPGLHSFRVLFFNMLVLVVFDIELDNSLLIATLLHEIDISWIAQMNLNVSFLNMNIYIKIFTVSGVDLIFIGLIFIQKIT